MSDSLYDVLRPHFDSSSLANNVTIPQPSDPVTAKYLSRLPKLDLAALQTSEPQSLAQSSHSTLLALQALSSRSSRTLISSADHLGHIGKRLPSIETYGEEIREGVAALDSQAVAFSTRYSRSTENHSELLDRRKRALLLARNVDRIGDILELPTLLASVVSSAAAAGAAASSGGSTSGSTATISATYNAALDLHGHVKRLATLHPNSAIVEGIGKDAAAAIRDMTTSLIQSLRGTNLKLAGGMRTIGWLRRVAPELRTASADDKHMSVTIGGNDEEGAFGALFLVCRLANLLNTLDALRPLRDLADQETTSRKTATTDRSNGSGHQTERYLKRFIELFREQSFGIVSMFRSIFPADEDISVEDLGLDLGKIGLGRRFSTTRSERPEPLPSALATFPLHLIEHVLMPTLREYLPSVRDKGARESLLTQVLYCAGSLGRLGGDFSVLLAGLYDDDDDDDDAASDDDAVEEKLLEWVDIMKKHRVQAARLESLAAGGSGAGSVKGNRPKEAAAAS